MTTDEQIEKVRTELSEIFYAILGGDSEFNIEGGYHPCADLADEYVDKVLAIPELAILHPDQSLPEGVFNYEQHKRIFIEANFRRVIKEALND